MHGIFSPKKAKTFNMEASWDSLVSETIMQEPEMGYQWEMITPQVSASSFTQCFQQSLSAESYNSPQYFPHTIQSNFTDILFDDGNYCTYNRIPTLDTGEISRNTVLLCKSNSPTHSFLGSIEKPKDGMRIVVPGNSEQQHKEVNVHRGLKKATGISTSHGQEHIIAERKRRLKLNQKFIALSAIIPGLKKVDKASILGDAARYVKELQTRVKDLEEQNKRQTVESVVLVKKSQVFLHDENSSSDENSDQQSSPKPFPEIEAKLSDKTVLMRIHCENTKGTIVKILSEIEKHHLSIINTNVMPFPGSCLNITVTAQIEEEFCLTVKGLVRELKWALS